MIHGLGHNQFYRWLQEKELLFKLSLNQTVQQEISTLAWQSNILNVDTKRDRISVPSFGTWK